MAEEVFSTEELQDYLQSYVIKNTKLVSPNFHMTKPSKEGDNYMSMVYRVTIEGTENGEAKNINFIMKTARKLLQFGDIKDRPNVFHREISFYQKILPIFKETIKERDGIIRCPTLYDANVEVGREILLLDNLNVEGFVMKKSKILDYPHLSLALRCLGEFHAYSFITRASNPTNFEKLKNITFLHEHWHDPTTNPHYFNKTLHSHLKVVSDIVIKALADEDKHYTERVQRFVDNMDNEMYDSTDGKQAEPYAVVIHGDFWTNNMLFKYDQERKPCDIRFVDFQVCRFASPVIDIVHSLFCFCAPETRSKYYDQLIHEYYETLSKYLERFGYDSNDLFPYKVLSQHLLKFGKYSAGFALICLPMVLNDSEDQSFAHMFSRDVLENRLETSSFFRNMLKSTFKDLVDKNYI